MWCDHCLGCTKVGGSGEVVMYLYTVQKYSLKQEHTAQFVQYDFLFQYNKKIVCN